MGIKRKSQRDKLAPRNAPYWEELLPGFAIGYRKTSSGRDSWNARLRMPDGKYAFRKVGGSETEWTEAKAAAEQWAGEVSIVGSTSTVTVEEAARSYADSMVGRTKGLTDSSFGLTLYGTPFASKELTSLRAADIKNWRDSLLTDTRGVDTANRIFRMLKAALNVAFREQLVASDQAWKVVPALRPHQDKRTEAVNRDRVYLTVAERQEFIAACPDDLADFARGLLITGARPGELARASVADLDLAEMNLRLTTTKGSRGVERERFVDLPANALPLFKRMAADKLPSAPLFCRDNGTAWGKDYWNIVIRRIVRPRCPLPATHVRLHNLRHTAITDWLQAGMEMYQVTRLAGTSVRMIEAHYGKYVKSHVRDVLANVQSF